MHKSTLKKSSNNAGQSLRTESRTSARVELAEKKDSTPGWVIKVTKGGSSGPSGSILLKKA